MVEIESVLCVVHIVNKFRLGHEENVNGFTKINVSEYGNGFSLPLSPSLPFSFPLSSLFSSKGHKDMWPKNWFWWHLSINIDKDGKGQRSIHKFAAPSWAYHMLKNAVRPASEGGLRVPRDRKQLSQVPKDGGNHWSRKSTFIFPLPSWYIRYQWSVWASPGTSLALCRCLPNKSSFLVLQPLHS